MTQIGPILGAEVHVALLTTPLDAARWDHARWDVGTWVDPDDISLNDVSCDAVSYTGHRGRDLPLERFRTGTAAIVLNDPHGKYTPWNVDQVGVAAIRPGIEVQVWVTVTGQPTPYDRFFGRVDAINDTFPDPGTGEHRVRFDCSDHMGLLAAYDGLEQAPLGDGELPGARLHRICDNAGYDKPRDFDAGNVTLQATTLAKNALDEAGMVCDTELGALYSLPDGTLRFIDRNNLLTTPEFVTPQAIFGEVEPELCYADIMLVSDTERIENIVSISNVGGTAVTVEDSASRSLYGPHTHRRFDLIHEDDAQSTVIANRHLDFYAYAANRIERLKPVVSLATLPSLLVLELLYQVQVRRRAKGFQVVADLQIESITETITADEWTLEFGTFSADAIFVVGRWDADVWDHGLWGF